MDVLLIEPYLKGFSGHHNRYVRVIARELSKRGLRLSVASSRYIDSDLQSALRVIGVQVIPIFENTPWLMRKSPDGRKIISRYLADTVLRCLTARPSARVAWLSGTGAQLSGACMFALEAKVPFAFQMLDFAVDWSGGRLAAPPELREEVTHAAAAGMKLHAQLPLLANVLQQELGSPVAPFPAILDLKPIRQRKPHDRPVAGIMNMMRSAKNPWPAVEAMIAHADRISIVLHLGRGAKGEDVEPAVRRIKALTDKYRLNGSQVKVIPGVLSPERYNAEWQGLDCNVMPYNAQLYRRKGSGMLFESLADGIIPIAPLGTSMAAAMREGKVGIGYDPEKPMAYFNAIAALLRNFDALAMQSREYAPVFLEKNSPARVVDILLAR